MVKCYSVFFLSDDGYYGCIFDSFSSGEKTDGQNIVDYMAFSVLVTCENRPVQNIFALSYFLIFRYLIYKYNIDFLFYRNYLTEKMD